MFGSDFTGVVWEFSQCDKPTQAFPDITMDIHRICLERISILKQHLYTTTITQCCVGKMKRRQLTILEWVFSFYILRCFLLLYWSRISTLIYNAGTMQLWFSFCHRAALKYSCDEHHVLRLFWEKMFQLMSAHEYDKKWFPKPRGVLDLYIFLKCVFVSENVQKGQRMLSA